MASKKYIENGERINGKVTKTETFDTDEFFNIIMDKLRDDIRHALNGYGKVNELKKNLKEIIEQMVDEDVKGKRLEYNN